MSDVTQFDRLSWVLVKNESGEDVPPHAVLRETGYDSDTNAVTVGKPDAEGDPIRLVNGPATIPSGGVGAAVWANGPLWVAYDSAGGTPANGETWGTESGSWELHAGVGRGATILGGGDGSQVLAFASSRLPIYGTNESGETAPAYGLARITGHADGVYTFDKPDTDNSLSDLLVVGPTAIGDGETGELKSPWEPPFYVYQTTSGFDTTGYQLGARAGQWGLTRGSLTNAVGWIGLGPLEGTPNFRVPAIPYVGYAAQFTAGLVSLADQRLGAGNKGVDSLALLSQTATANTSVSFTYWSDTLDVYDYQGNPDTLNVGGFRFGAGATDFQTGNLHFTAYGEVITIFTAPGVRTICPSRSIGGMTFTSGLYTGGDVEIDTGDIADDAVTSDKIADDAVGTDQLADDAVTAVKILDGEVPKDGDWLGGRTWS